MYPRIEQAIKDQILEEIKNGSKVAETARKHNVSEKTVYGWLSKQADNTGTSNLEIAKLRRENQELKELIGLLTLENKRVKKNLARP